MNAQEKQPKPGDTVILMEIPPGFVDDSPTDDREAISDVIGKHILLNEYGDHGLAELEFRDGSRSNSLYLGEHEVH